LHDAGVIRYNVPAAATSTSGGSSSTGGGNMGGGSSSSSSSRVSSDYQVNIGGNGCTVSVMREISSSDNLSMITTTLINKGGSGCTMTDFVFTDTIPSSFAGINEITFSPAYSAREGWSVSFNFPSFAPGESKTLVYSVGKWVGASRLAGFNTYAMAGKAQAALPPAIVETPITPAKQGEPNLSVSAPSKTIVLNEEAAQQPLLVNTFYSDALASLWWIVLVMLAMVGVAYLYVAGEERKKLQNGKKK